MNQLFEGQRQTISPLKLKRKNKYGKKKLNFRKIRNGKFLWNVFQDLNWLSLWILLILKKNKILV